MYYAFTPNSVFKSVLPFGLRTYLINQYVILRYYSSNLCKWHYLYGDLPFFMTERLHFHFSLSGIGEGNGNAPQYSWLDNPRNGGVWWAAICGVTQSRTRQKWLGRPLYLLLRAGTPQKKWSSHHGQQKSMKCSTWMQSQKRQNDLCSFPRQTIQYHGNPSLCPNQ